MHAQPLREPDGGRGRGDSGRAPSSDPDDLASERALAASEGLDRLDARAIVRLLNAEDRRAVEAVAAVEDALARAVDALVERLARGGRLVYAGAGTSGRLGALDAAECPPTFGTAPERVVALLAGGRDALVRAVEGAEDDRDAGARDVAALGLGPDDTVCALSASGRTPYALGALDAAQAAGALTLCVTCNPGSPLARAARIAIEPLTGAEVLAGSTRLKAGTATKLVLNALTTAAFARLGHTVGNRMRHLRATNAKLAERAARILAAERGLDLERARAELAAHGGDLAAALGAERS